MHNLIHQEVSEKDMGAKYVARHLSTRMHHGKVVIVTQTPHATISAVRKQWLKLVRRVQKERSSTLDASRIGKLAETVIYMRSLKFTVRYPPDDYRGDVYITTPYEVLIWPPSCETMYVLCDIGIEQLHLLTAWMPKKALLVTFKVSSHE